MSDLVSEGKIRIYWSGMAPDGIRRGLSDAEITQLAIYLSRRAQWPVHWAIVHDPGPEWQRVNFARRRQIATMMRRRDRKRAKKARARRPSE